MHDDEASDKKVHFNLARNGYKSCMCSCSLCLGKWVDCLCKECSCHDATFTLHDHDPDGAKPPALRGKPLRPCLDCGKEIYRTHPRGRWPLRCIACRT